MKVLLCDATIHSVVGGGQRVYNQLIRSNPDIEFHTFLKPHLPLPKNLPKNVVVRPWKTIRPKVLSRTVCNGKLFAEWIFDAVFNARELAIQVVGESFDVVDLPDYFSWGLFMRPAFEQFQVKCKTFALALHGSCSTTSAMEWDGVASSSVSANIREFLQYRAADIRYGLSRRYIAEWASMTPEKAHYIDPLDFIDLPQPIPSWSREGKCNLVFVGRPEKRKGPDIFVEMLKRIPKDQYHKAMLVGPDSPHSNEYTAQKYLVEEARKHGIVLEDAGVKNGVELRALYGERTVVFAPSRYDTFNLVAIESLFSGCPTVIGSGAGVTDFLAEKNPSVPFLNVDPLQPDKIIEPLVAMLRNYDQCRSDVNEAVRQITRKPELGFLESVLSQPHETSDEINQLGAKWYEEWTRDFCDVVNPDKQRLRVTGNRLARNLAKELQITGPSVDVVYELLSPYPEHSRDDIRAKLCALWDTSASVTCDRVRIWNEIGRLERMRGNLNLWATYKLRSMRALDEVETGDLADLVKSLGTLGFLQEAEAICASRKTDSALQYLQSRYDNNLELPQFEYQEIIDQRERLIEPKVAIIASLYDAADKLEYFLRRISEQTILASRQVEIILVDSGSPKNEKDVFLRLQAERALPVLYARSQQRETIQTAWNRGISLSRAPYLCFLGVDETLRPDALAILCKALDDEPSLDWVTGDSTITEVDRHGRFIKDIMSYNRSGYHQDLVQLETCYLSWVGALYRKSIHSRFGYYDGSFRAAGDTEFKNRVLSKISSKAIPDMLGVFLNYPCERATASPLAEIEDCRAWYLHRTLAGVQYTYANRSVSDLERQIIRCLGYRKSYLKSKSTDFLYAKSLLRYLEIVAPQSELMHLKPGIDKLLGLARMMDFVDAPNAIRISQLEFEWSAVLKEILPLHSRISGRTDLEYGLYNDNRYQQHYWPWRVEQDFVSNTRGLRYVWP